MAKAKRSVPEGYSTVTAALVLNDAAAAIFGAVIDPFGYRWSLATHKEDLTPEEIKIREAEWMKQMAAGKPA